MKRYLTFAGHAYYAEGGWSDFVGDHDDLQPAIDQGVACFENDECRWFHVVDTTTKLVVAYKHGECTGSVGAKLIAPDAQVFHVKPLSEMED